MRLPVNCPAGASRPLNVMTLPEGVESVINTGIIGGNDIDFFRRYCETAEQFRQRNRQALSQINVGLFCTISNEYLFNCLVTEEARKVKLYIDVSPTEVRNTVMRFHLVPFVDKYIHLAGQAKKNKRACEQMEYRFRFEFPKEYGSIIKTLTELCPYEPAAFSNHPQKWSRLKKAFGVLYTANAEEWTGKRLRLSEGVQIKKANEHAEKERWLSVGSANDKNDSSWLLKERDEAPVHFQSPVCIAGTPEALKEQGYLHDEESLAQHRFKLLDFVTEKMTIDGVLEFV